MTRGHDDVLIIREAPQQDAERERAGMHKQNTTEEPHKPFQTATTLQPFVIKHERNDLMSWHSPVAGLAPAHQLIVMTLQVLQQVEMDGKQEQRRDPVKTEQRYIDIHQWKLDTQRGH